MEKDYLKLVQDLQDRATGAVKAFHGVRIALYGTLAAACLLHRQIMQDDPQLLENAYAAANISFKSKSDQQSLYRPWLRLIYRIDNAHGYMSNKVGDYAAAMCEMEKHVNSDPGFFELDGEARLAQYIEAAGGIHALARKHRGEPMPVNNDDAQDGTGDDDGGNDDDDGDGDGDKPTPPANFKKIADAAVELLLNANLVALGTMNPMCPVAVAENGLVVMIGLKRPDGLFKIVGSTAAKDVIRRAAVEATVNQLGGVPDDLAVLAEVASVAKYPSQALPASDEGRQAWLDNKYFDVVKARAANSNDPAAAPLTTKREMVVDSVNNTVRYSGSGYHRSVVIHCTPRTGLSLRGSYLHLGQRDCARLEDLVDNGVQYLRKSAANDDLALQQTAILAEDALTGDQHEFAFANDLAAAGKGCADFDFALHRPDWTAQLDRGAIQHLRGVMLDTYFKKLGKSNQVTRPNNKQWGVLVSQTGIAFAHNRDTTDICEVDGVSAAVQFAANANTASYEVRTKDFGAVFYRIACLPLTAGIDLAGDMQALVLRFSTNLGNYAVAIPTIIANDNADIGVALFKKEI